MFEIKVDYNEYRKRGSFAGHHCFDQFNLNTESVVIYT